MTSSDVQKLGLITCSAVVAGNMMGSGIALLPANLARIGSIVIFGWLLAGAGALGLAYVYAKLGLTDPQEGGPIAYSGEVSPILGYQSGLLYFHANWIGNLAIAITAVDYLSVFVPILEKPIPAGIATIVVIWIFTALNLLGARWIGRLVTIGLVALLVPIVLTGTAGWFFFDVAKFNANWNVSHQSDTHAVIAAVILCIWAFIGVESASVNAGLVKNPKRNIPLATIIGTTLAGIVYVASSTAIMGMFPAKQVAASGAPFSLATANMFGQWCAPVVSVITAFACLASLGSWIMMVAEAGARAAKDGTLPAMFARRNKRDIPVTGILLTSTFMTVLMVALMFLSDGKSTQGIFGEIISIAVLLTIFPYFYSALQCLKLGFAQRLRAIVQIVLSSVAGVLCFVALAGAEHTQLIWTVIIILVCFGLYVTKDRTQFEAAQEALRHKQEDGEA